MRTFISIPFPDEVIKEIRIVQDSLPEFSGKKIEKENLHLTLKFLGEIDEKKVEEIKKRLRKIKFSQFEIELGNIGIFSEEFIRIVWIMVSDCEELQKKIDESLEDLFKKEQRFIGHLTIARVKKIEDKKEFLVGLNKISVPKVYFKIKKFYLMKSELGKKGPVYSIIEEYSL